MISAIEECSALLQECNEGFENLCKQNYDSEADERDIPSDAEFEPARDK
jgi:hypothetical protein